MTKLALIKLITMYSLQYGIDPNIAVAVVATESSFDYNAIGITGDVGLFQLRPSSFPQYTTYQLLNPRLNIRLGVWYLSYVRKHCTHKEGVTWLICYNYGFKNAHRVKHPKLFPYIKRIDLAMRNLEPLAQKELK